MRVYDRLVRTNKATYDKAVRLFRTKADAHVIIRRYESGRRGYFIWTRSRDLLERGAVYVEGIPFRTQDDADAFHDLCNGYAIEPISGARYEQMRRECDFITSESVYTYLNKDVRKTAVKVMAVDGNYYFAVRGRQEGKE